MEYCGRKITYFKNGFASVEGVWNQFLNGNSDMKTFQGTDRDDFRMLGIRSPLKGGALDGEAWRSNPGPVSSLLCDPG